MEFTNEQLEKDLVLLLEHFILVGNSLKGKKMPVGRKIRYAEPLGKKTVSHILSSLNLYRGTTFILSDNSTTSLVDFSSIAVITRAAIESYLTFNFVFITPKTNSERDFRFFCWDIAGFVERERFFVRDDKANQKLLQERELKKLRIKDLEGNVVFNGLSENEKKAILKGDWRIHRNWIDLAKLGGLPEVTFRNIYSYLCSFSHSGRLSVLQIEQNSGFNVEKEFSNYFLTINLLILARLLVDYVYLIPTCQEIFKSNEQAVYKTIMWNEIGDRLNP